MTPTGTRHVCSVHMRAGKALIHIKENKPQQEKEENVLHFKVKWKGFLCSPDFQLLPYACLSPCKNLCVFAPTWQVLFRRRLCPLSALSWEVGGQMKKKRTSEKGRGLSGAFKRWSAVCHPPGMGEMDLGAARQSHREEGLVCYSVWLSQPLTQAGKGALRWGPGMPSWRRVSSLPGQPMLAFLLGPQQCQGRRAGRCPDHWDPQAHGNVGRSRGNMRS